MISAKEARILSENEREYQDFWNLINKKIIESAKKGQTAYYLILREDCWGVPSPDIIQEMLSKKGYEVSVNRIIEKEFVEEDINLEIMIRW